MLRSLEIGTFKKKKILTTKVTLVPADLTPFYGNRDKRVQNHGRGVSGGGVKGMRL